MSSDEFLKELSPYQTELASRIFDLAISRVLKNAYIQLDEKTKGSMNIIFDLNNDQDKENFIKKNIPDFKELFEKELKNIEDSIKSEIEKQI
jgi:hypothetical protein